MKRYTIILLLMGFIKAQDDQVGVLIPWYNYPIHWSSDYQWDDLANAASEIPITAIINANNGPGTGGPNADYVVGMSALADKVTTIGYVFTGYGTRDISTVKTEIDEWANNWVPHGLSGIFIDEMSTETSTLAYYEELYDYILSKSGLDQVHGNPGMSSEEAFVSAPTTTSLVISENYMSEWTSHSTDSWVNEYDAARFSMLVHTASTTGEMQTAIDLAVQRNIGLVYVTDDVMPNPWDKLPTYWQEKVKYIKSINQGNDSEEPTFTDIDTNGDGCISEEEFDNARDGN